MTGGPVPGHGQAGSAEQAGGVPALELPVSGGVGEVTVDPQARAVVGEPLVQPRPGRQQRFVGDLDGVLVGGDQAGIDQVRENRAGRGGTFVVFGAGEFGED